MTALRAADLDRAAPAAATSTRNASEGLGHASVDSYAPSRRPAAPTLESDINEVVGWHLTAPRIAFVCLGGTQRL